MKRINASLMTVAVVLALIAFIAPSSAYSITNSVVSYDPVTDSTTWTFKVTQGGFKWNVSHIVVAWCNENAVESVTITPDYLKWRGYGTFDYNKPPCKILYTITGIKVEFEKDPPATFDVEIILNGPFETRDNVGYIIKAARVCTPGVVYGPFAGGACTDPIPEFSTIAIPIASILGLLFFFNHRKRREK